MPEPCWITWWCIPPVAHHHHHRRLAAVAVVVVINRHSLRYCYCRLGRYCHHTEPLTVTGQEGWWRGIQRPTKRYYSFGRKKKDSVVCAPLHRLVCHVVKRNREGTSLLVSITLQRVSLATCRSWFKKNIESPRTIGLQVHHNQRWGTMTAQILKS